MARQTFAHYITSAARRALEALAVIASFQNPDGSPFGGGALTTRAVALFTWDGDNSRPAPTRMPDVPCRYVILANNGNGTDGNGGLLTDRSLYYASSAAQFTYDGANDMFPTYQLFELKPGQAERIEVENTNQIFVMDVDFDFNAYNADVPSTYLNALLHIIA